MNKEDIVEEFEDEFHNGPFGPVEFGCTITENNDQKTISIYHFKVHKDYQNHGYGKETLRKVIEKSLEYDEIENIEITIGGGEDTKAFLEIIGFSNVELGSNGSVRAIEKVSELENKQN